MLIKKCAEVVSCDAIWKKSKRDFNFFLTEKNISMYNFLCKMSLSKSVNFHIFRSSLTDQWANGWTKPHHACLQLEMALMAVAVMNMTNQALGQEE